MRRSTAVRPGNNTFFRLPCKLMGKPLEDRYQSNLQCNCPSQRGGRHRQER